MDKDQIIEKANNVDGLEGMTVNERLWASGLTDLFDKVRSKDKKIARTILEALKVDNNSTNKILN